LLVGGDQLQQSTIALANTFVQRDTFKQSYPDQMSSADFVNKLFDTAGLTPFAAERQQEISALMGGTKTRAQVLLDVIEIPDFKSREFNPAFVLMEYFGYLHRAPDQAGYDFWLNVLNNREPNNFRGMVSAFVTSQEYRDRFALPPLLGVAAWRQDLQVLATQLPALHKNAFANITPQQFNQAVAQLDQDIPNLQEPEIVVRFIKIAAMIGDGHTTIHTGGSPEQFKVYPLVCYWFTDGLYVIQASAPYRSALGMRVVRIGQTSVDDANNIVKAEISHENDAWVMAQSPARLVSPEILFTERILPDMQTGHFVFQRVSGEQFALDVAPVSSRETINYYQAPDPSVIPTPLYRHNPTLNYWFDYVPDSQTLYFQYNVCQNMVNLPFSQFAQQMNNFSATHAVSRLVIDLRNNGGGDSTILQAFINGVAATPDINRPDRLFVIIGRQTFSSALLNAISLRQQTNGTFVGEPTGGKPNAYGEVQSFNLPNSQLTVQYSTKFFQTVPGDPLSLFPDNLIQLSSADYLAGRDPVMAWITGN
jgi:hypothetical protein